MVSERRYYVYIMSSRSRVIYVGMTGYLMARVLRHRAGGGGEFTRKYRVHRLVYFESFQNVENAIARETEIKKWRREKKVELIRRESDLGGFGGGVGGSNKRGPPPQPLPTTRTARGGRGLREVTDSRFAARGRALE